MTLFLLFRCQLYRLYPAAAHTNATSQQPCYRGTCIPCYGCCPSLRGLYNAGWRAFPLRLAAPLSLRFAATATIPHIAHTFFAVAAVTYAICACARWLRSLCRAHRHGSIAFTCCISYLPAVLRGCAYTLPVFMRYWFWFALPLGWFCLLLLLRTTAWVLNTWFWFCATCWITAALHTTCAPPPPPRMPPLRLLRLPAAVYLASPAAWQRAIRAHRCAQPRTTAPRHACHSRCVVAIPAGSYHRRAFCTSRGSLYVHTVLRFARLRVPAGSRACSDSLRAPCSAVKHNNIL